jgi:hypothetical protein
MRSAWLVRLYSFQNQVNCCEVRKVDDDDDDDDKEEEKHNDNDVNTMLSSCSFLSFIVLKHAVITHEER